MKHKIYCFNNGGSPGWYNAMAIADDGHCLAQHICSHEAFMSHDLGITSDWKHENYNKHFGEGNWELEWVADPLKHEGLEAAYQLNQKLAQEQSRNNMLNVAQLKKSLDRFPDTWEVQLYEDDDIQGIAIVNNNGGKSTIDAVIEVP